MAQQKEIPSKSSSFPISLIISMLLSVAIVVFAIQNAKDIALKAFIWRTEIPLALLLFITLGIGIIITVLYSIPGWNKQRKIKNHLNKRIKELEQELKTVKEKANIKEIESKNEPM